MSFSTSYQLLRRQLTKTPDLRAFAESYMFLFKRWRGKFTSK